MEKWNLELAWKIEKKQTSPRLWKEDSCIYKEDPPAHKVNSIILVGVDAWNKELRKEFKEKFSAMKKLPVEDTIARAVARAS